MAWLASIPPALAALGTIVWPESPSWLAYKGRFDECVTSFEWIRGRDMESKREVKELITAQQELRNIKSLKKSGLLIRNLQAIKSKEFLKPSVDVNNFDPGVRKTSKAYYYTIGLDVMKILAILTSSYIVRIFYSLLVLEYVIGWCVMVPLIFHHLAIGFVLSYPAVLTPAITGNDTSNGTEVHATKGEASWIAAAYSMTGGIGFLILPPLMQLYGRRFINATMNLLIFLGWIIIALSPNVPTLIAGRAIQGLSFGGLYICSILAGEYSHPKRRGFFITFKITATSIGELICHGFGFTLPWRQMAWLASIPPALAALGTIVWPESPSWLAYKGRFDECVTSFEWIRGRDMESKREVKELITAQQELRNIKRLKKSGLLIRNLQAMKSKEFLKPFTVVLMLIILTQVCGRHYLLAYVVQIMISLTGDKSKAYYYTIGLDVMKILAILTSSYIVRIFKRRVLLLHTGNVACILLSLVCIFHLLVHNEIINITWITPLLLILYNIICYVGVIPVSMVLKGELFPIEYKGLGTSILGIFYSLSSMVLMKSTSVMLDTLDTHGTFAVYLIIAVASLVCLDYILPETKDRTLQDIELEFMDIKLPKDDDGFEMSTVVNRNLLVSK